MSMLNKIQPQNISNIKKNNYCYANSDKNSSNNSVCTNSDPFINSHYLKNNVTFTSASQLKTDEEQKMYKEIKKILSTKSKEQLNVLLSTGRLLNRNSNDKSSTLENLYKIATTPRIVNLDMAKILETTIATIANPFIINQNFGEIPDFMVEDVLNEEKRQELIKGIELNSTPRKNSTIAKTKEDLRVDASGSCVAASIEFNLADKKPAEYARYVEGLTSPAMAVKTTIKYSNIATNFVDAINFLNQFKVKYQPKNWEEVEITLHPDRSAIIRARVQNSYYKKGSRSTIDTLMQSTFMQLGSENTYNSITDKRYGEFNSNEKGLTEFEKNFTESIVDSESGKTSVTYQIVDDDAKLTGFFVDYETIKNQIMEALNTGTNIIIGITEVDDTQKIIGGHEITIIGSRTDVKGDLYFICNDTDDDYVGAIEIKAKDLIPKIHHAGIPNKILKIEEQEEIGYQLLREYKTSQLQSKMFNKTEPNVNSAA